ncbi:hypothetical protein ACEPAI_9826 [Sanghuangporus weigelae]
MPWFNYWAFDVIGDLAFGSPFGMIRNARDIALTAVDPEAAMADYGVVKNETVDEFKPVYSTCAITYYIAAHPRVRIKRQKEFDEALGVDSV